jgi:hypothetical protein
MFERIPGAKAQGARLVALRFGNTALTLLLIILAAGAAAAELTFDIKIEGGRVPEAMRLIGVTEGDVVKLRCTSDRPLVLHLHGYDIEKRVAPGAVSELVFTANATGRFPIHLHEQGAGVGGHAHEDLPLATVEVYPQ